MTDIAKWVVLVPLCAGCYLAYDKHDPASDAGSNGPPDPDGMLTAASCGKLDIVLVVDSSGSMVEEQAAIPASLLGLAKRIADFRTTDNERVDYRIAVTTMGRNFSYMIDFAGSKIPQTEIGDDGAFRDGCGVSRRWLESTDADLETALLCRANVGTNGGSFEMPLLASKLALDERLADTNAGFLRDDAKLGLIYLTDEDDSSTTLDGFVVGPDLVFPPNWNPADQIEFLDTLKGSRSRWSAVAIAGDTPCTTPLGDAAEAIRLKQFVAGSQSELSTICDGELATGFEAAALKFLDAACD